MSDRIEPIPEESIKIRESIFGQWKITVTVKENYLVFYDPRNGREIYYLKITTLDGFMRDLCHLSDKTWFDGILLCETIRVIAKAKKWFNLGEYT